MKPVIAAFDEHDHATAALRWAVEYSRATGAPLRVVSVFEPTYSEIAPDWLEELLVRRREAVQKVLAEVGHADADIVVLTHPDPVQSIASYLRDHHAAMVVLGAHGSGGPGGLGASGPAHHLLQHSHVPVAIVRPDYRSLGHGNITVGVDGSTANAVALKHAAGLAESVDGVLHAVFAYDPMDDTFVHADGWHRHAEEVRREVHKTSNVDVKLFQAAGHPADVLIEHARREHAAAIVVGTRGRGGFKGLRVGRVPIQLASHASCPLIVVPH